MGPRRGVGPTLYLQPQPSRAARRLGALLQARGIELLTDDLYRPGVLREGARRLVEERREWERSSVEKARQLQESFESLPIPGGLPALEDGSAMASIMAHDPGYQTVAEEFGRPKPTFLDDMLEAGQRQQLAERAAIKERKKDNRPGQRRYSPPGETIVRVGF